MLPGAEIMIKTFKRHFRVLKAFAKISLTNQLVYKPSFFLALLGKTLRLVLLIVFFDVVFLKTKVIGTWNFNQILLLIGTADFLQLILRATFHRNLAYYFPQEDLKMGLFDFKLVKPINTLFYTSFAKLDFMDIFSMIPTLIVIAVALKRLALSLTIGNISLYLLLMTNALLFIYSLLLILATISFWSVQSTGMGRLFENIIRLSRYPTDIYHGLLRTFIMYVLPISIIAVVPSQSLLGTLNPQYMLYAFGFSIILFFIAIRFWNFGLRHYSSVGG